MSQTLPRTAFLISATGDLKGDEVYAVREASEADALARAAKMLNCEITQVAIVGGMAESAVRTLKLKPGEVRRV